MEVSLTDMREIFRRSISAVWIEYVKNAADVLSFPGVPARSNETAAFIVDCLKKETTKEKIVDAVYNEYEASRDEISSDVDEILSKLRSINAIEE